MNIIQDPATPSDYSRGRAEPEVTHVALHIEEGSEAGTDAWFADARAGVSAHYSIGKDGTIRQHVAEADTAWAVGLAYPFKWADPTRDPHRDANPNSYTISIEHEGKIEDAPPWPDAQVQASAALVADICARHAIAITRQFVVRHSEIGGHPLCPGVNAPVDQIVALAAAINA
jgi:N-acetylmuramoyl-L-alanine amidase